jgi:hypothetical protein
MIIQTDIWNVYFFKSRESILSSVWIALTRHFYLVMKSALLPHSTCLWSYEYHENKRVIFGSQETSEFGWSLSDRRIDSQQALSRSKEGSPWTFRERNSLWQRGKTQTEMSKRWMFMKFVTPTCIKLRKSDGKCLAELWMILKQRVAVDLMDHFTWVFD